MPRNPDVGWQHGSMVGGYRHHIKCHYCHSVTIGGITRFKRHLVGEGEETNGCEAAPKDVKDAIRKQLETWEPRKYNTKKKRADGIFSTTLATHMDLDADASRSGTRENFDGLGEQRTCDVGWAHGLTVKGDKRKVECKYCHKIISGGGVSRLKQHLAGQRGNIAPCDNVPDEVRAQMQEYLGSKLESQEILENDGVLKYINDAPKDASTGGSRKIRVKDDGGNFKKRKKLEASYSPLPSTTLQPIRQLPFTSPEYVEQADVAVAKFIYENGISFDAVNSLYFQRMADAIAAVGPGYKMPSYHSLRGALLNRCVKEAEEFSNDLRKSWEVTGCTVLVDRWKDRVDRSIINFFIYCPKGTLFLKSVDVSGIETSLEDLVALFDTVVEDVGRNFIVHFVADDDPWYTAAGKLLVNKHKTFFWSVSVNHYIELMLKGLDEMDEVRWVMSKAKKVSQTIYNNQWVLDLFKKITRGKDLVQRGRTKTVTDFLTIKSMFSLKDLLQQTFGCANWEQSEPSLQKLGMDVREILSDMQFWQSCGNILKVSEPLITVWNLADSGDRPSIGFIYDAVEKAKKSITLAFNEEYEYLPYFNIINQARDDLHSPLHAAAYYLNPSMFYSTTSSLSSSSIIQRGFLDCVETLEPDLVAQDNIMKQKTFYEGALGDFGRSLAVRGRDSLAPAAWWSSYASEYPDLQQFAIKILSQTCSLIPFERSRDLNEDICSSKNKLEGERLNKLSFVHYNFRLRRRQPAGKTPKVLFADDHDPLAINDENGEEWIKDPDEDEDNKDAGIKLVDIFGPTAAIPPVDIFSAAHVNLSN